jgi:replicative DNA helicase
MTEEAAYITFALVIPETLDHHPVNPVWFSNAKHRKALGALRDLHAQGRGTAAELDEVMGPGYSDSLPPFVDLPFSPAAMPGVLREQHQRRTVADALMSLQSDLKSATVSIQERLSTVVGKLLEAQEESEQVASFTEVLRSAFDRVEKCHANRWPLGIPTGWANLDDKIGGWEPEKLYFVCARPGAGKTSFGFQAIVHAAKAGHRVYVSSQEMGKTQVGLRLISQEGRISSERLRTGNLEDADWPKAVTATGVLRGLPGWIDTRTGISFDQLRSMILRCHAKEPVGLVLVDYVQMMRGKGESKVYELESIAYGLKSLAKEIQAPILCLSQLNRGAEDNPKEPPKLTQMRGSGGLEQAADVVIILWTPDPKQKPNTVEIRVAKHRDGPTGKFPAQFNRAYTIFE